MQFPFSSIFRKHILSLFLFFGVSTNAFSQETYRITHWDIEQGLSFGLVNNMIKDQLGFVWMATAAGLNRFDGNHFNNYFPEPGKKNAVASGSILGLIEDSLHNIWIGTDNGLSRYNIKADSFTNFKSLNTDLSSNTFIIPFWATEEEVYCIESSSIITAYNTRTLSRQVLVNHFDNDENKDYLRYSFSVLDSVNQCIWMLAKGGLLEISLSTGKQVLHPGNYYDAPAMRYDFNRNLIWLNAGGGLLQFTLSNKQFRIVDALKEKDYEPYAGFDIDREGRVWAATVKKGILIYNPSDGSVSRPFPDTVNQQMVSQANMCLYCDRLGITWTGNWALKGVYQLNPFKACVKRFTTDSAGVFALSALSIGNMLNGPRGNLWISTEHGIDVFDPKTDHFRIYTAKDFPGMKGKYISPVLIDTVSQKVLICSGPPYALTEMNLKTRQIRNIFFRDSMDHVVSTDNEDFDNTVFQYKQGTIIYIKNQGIFLLKKDSSLARLVIGLRQENVTYIMISPDGHLFLHLYGTPLNLTYTDQAGKWIRSVSLLDSLEWSGIFYDQADSTYWVGSTKRLIHYNNQLQELHSYGENDGFPGISASGILADNLGNIWFNNNQGDLSRLSISTGKIISLSGKDGLQKQRFNWNSPHVKDVYGNLYFAGNAGIDEVSPEKLQENYPPSFVYLRAVQINDESFSPPSGVNDLPDLSLDYFQNRINIEAGTIDFFSNNFNIRCRIEGITENWQYGPASNPISLDGVSPGNYRVSMQASNALNEYNGPEKTIQIHIYPPWWKTWWGYGLFILLAGIVFWTFFQYRSRRLKERNTELEENVLHRTKELKHSLEELRETQAQLIQREKMASLGELTAGIAHEIQNPLNFVNNFSEVNMELTTELKDELAKMNLDVKDKTLLEEIAGNITENEQKINHHGKRADAIVKGMLQHSRTSTGLKEPTSINELADEFLRLAYHGLRAKNNTFNATMKTDFDPGIQKINIVAQDIGRVLLNLYTNAFYALAEKTKLAIPGYDPVITVTTKKLADKIEIRIQDNGMGIPGKLLDKIFQPFFTTKPAGEGTGLGLSLSYDIVKAHSGELKVETEEEKSSLFTIYLPA